MKLSLRAATSRATYLERKLSGDVQPALVDGDDDELEASLHELGHILALRGSLHTALCGEQVTDVDILMKEMGVHGIARDENEVSAIAIELLASTMIGLPIDSAKVIDFAWGHGNVSYFVYRDVFEARVVRRMQNARCRKLATELAQHLAAPKTRRR